MLDLLVAVAFALFLAYHALRIVVTLRRTTRVAGRSLQGIRVDAPGSGNWVFPRVTFLVAGWNAKHDIRPFLESFYSLGSIDRQLVICIGGPDGGYADALAMSSSDVVVLEQVAGMGKQGALRAGLPHADGEWIYLTDVDSRLSPECVTAMMFALSEGGAECVTGGMSPLMEQRQEAFVCAQWGIERYGQIRAGDYVAGILGANTLLKRSAVETTGSFSAAAPSGTDYTLAKQLVAAGFAIKHVKNAEIETEFSHYLRTYIKRRSRWLRNVVTLGRRYGCYREVRSVYLTIALSFLYPALLLAGVAWHFLWSVFCLLFLHSILNRTRYCAAAGIPVRLMGITKTFIGDAAAGILAAVGAARGSTKW